MSKAFTYFYKFRTQVLALSEKLEESKYHNDTIESDELDRFMLDITQNGVSAMHESLMTYAAFVQLPHVWPLFDKFCQEYYEKEE